MNLWVIYILSIVCWAMSDTVCNNENCSSNDFTNTNGTSSRVLSRRKRFLIFPDGSSFQLVFCCQTAALIPIGDIFLFGNTAALAWNLPTDPDFLLMFKKHNKQAHRRGDNMNVYYVDEAGKLVAKVPYRRPKIVNPAFAKRSVDSTLTYKEKLKMNINRKKMHESQIKINFLEKHLDEKSIEFHRSSRVGLLEKIEGLVTALGGDGRQCVLRKLCETGNVVGEQGEFLQELLRVVFTELSSHAIGYNTTRNFPNVERRLRIRGLPKGNEFELEEHKEYDKASSLSSNCGALYPGCDDFGIPVQL